MEKNNNGPPSPKNKKIEDKITYCPIKKNKKSNNKIRMKDINMNSQTKDIDINKNKIQFNDINNKEKKFGTSIHKLKKVKIKRKNKKISFKQINIVNFNFRSIKNHQKRNKNKSYSMKNISGSSKNLALNIKSQLSTIRKNEKPETKAEIIYKSYKPDIYHIKNYNLNIDIEEYMEPSLDNMDYDDVIEEDKRKYCQYFCEKIKDNQNIINIFFIEEIIKRRSIKISIFIVTIDIYILTNGLFFSDSYISEIFNSNEKETFFSFIPRSIDRFVYIRRFPV